MSVDAIWNGPWGYKLPDGTELIPGETQVSVPEEQAQDDPYWTADAPIGLSLKAPQGGDK